jgi:hypothetical protein
MPSVWVSDIRINHVVAGSTIANDPIDDPDSVRKVKDLLTDRLSHRHPLT